MLINQPANQCGLHQKRSRNRQHLRTILLPYTRVAKMNFTPRWKSTLADAPALQFPPVKFWSSKSDWRNLDFCGSFSPNNSQGDLGRYPPPLLHRDKRPADDAIAEIRIVI